MTTPPPVLPDGPFVPERRRFCAVCRRPVGRRRTGSPGRVVGFCTSCRTPFSFVPPLRTGDLLRSGDGRHYKIDKCLRHGVQGWVYRATALTADPGIGAAGSARPPVLLKCLADGAAAGEVDLALLRSLRHDGVVRTVDLVHHDGSPYLVTEFVQGQAVHDLLRRRHVTHLPPQRSLRWVAEVLDALDYLHSRGFAHGDVAPDNVVVGPDDGVTLVDLGTLRPLTRPAAALFLTPGYDAPELAATGPSVAADVYATSRLLARLLQAEAPGSPPSDGRSGPPAGVRGSRLADLPALAAVLRRGTATDPGDRFPNAQAMATAVRRLTSEIAGIDADGPLLGQSTQTTPIQRSDRP